MIARVKLLLKFFYTTYHELQKDHPALLAGGLSYFALFSLAPVMIISTALLGHVWSHQSVQETMFGKLSPILGADTTDSLAGWLELTTRGSKGKATLFSFVALYLAAGRIFAQLRTAMNIIWDLPLREDGFFKTYFRTTGQNFAMIACLIAFIFVFLITDASMAVVVKLAQHYIVGFQHLPLLQGVHVALPILLFSLLFGAIYKFVPDTHVPWSDVWPGAIVTSVLFAIGKSVISLYFSFENFNTLYGAASSVIVIMVWIYFATHIFFFGAEFTWLYSKQYGSRSRSSPAL